MCLMMVFLFLLGMNAAADRQVHRSIINQVENVLPMIYFEVHVSSFLEMACLG